jgi:hypothetical protein
MRREIPIAFPIMVGAIGLILVIYSSVSLAKVRAAARWPAIMGIVMESSVQTEQRERERRQTVPFYSARVRYEYKVNGSPFSSDKIKVNSGGKPRSEESQKLVARYPVGSTVWVRYNPENPADAVLELAPESETRAVFGAGITMVVVALVMMAVRAIRRHRKPHS